MWAIYIYLGVCGYYGEIKKKSYRIHVSVCACVCVCVTTAGGVDMQLRLCFQGALNAYLCLNGPHYMPSLHALTSF